MVEPREESARLITHCARPVCYAFRFVPRASVLVRAAEDDTGHRLLIPAYGGSSPPALANLHDRPDLAIKSKGEQGKF